MTETLVVHPGSLGDVLLAVPALRALRSAFPRQALALAAQSRIARLFAALGVIDAAIAFDALGLDALFAEEGSLDAEGENDGDETRPSLGARVADGSARPLQTSTDGSGRWPDPRLARAARVACWFGAADPGFTRRLLAIAPGAVIARSVPSDGGLVWGHLVHTIADWASGQLALHPIAVPPALLSMGRELLQQSGAEGPARLLMVHPGAGSAAKRWSAAAFARVLDGFAAAAEMTMVVHEGPADSEAVAELLAHLRRPAIRLRDPKLDAVVGALAHASVYLGNDSGISHLAAAVGTPAVVLFTPAMLGWRPWAPAHTVVVDCARIAEADVQAVTAALQTVLAAPVRQWAARRSPT